MIVFYLLFLALFRVALYIGKFFHPKTAELLQGQHKLLHQIEARVGTSKAPLVWVHCASLGEFEQGRPLIERFRAQFPSIKILLTFFSPSGYRVRKNYELADFVFYLPLESPWAARKFVSVTQPQIAIFVKYEFWYYYTKELHRLKIPILSVSSIFRKDQLFFKPYGGFYRRILSRFSYFFVQNRISHELLQSIGITNATVTGDTRFDRVNEMVSQRQANTIAERFKGNNKAFIIGSCWPEDMDVLVPFINENFYQLKFIIAPHEITERFIQDIEASVQVKAIRYSKVNNQTLLDEYQVLIIDNIGMLSSLYYYGEFAFVGGGFGKGIHNILEAACYGVPIFFGNRNYKKYQEAVELIMRGGAFEINDYPDLRSKYELINTPESFLLACEVTRLYVEENLGATNKIMEYCSKLIDDGR